MPNAVTLSYLQLQVRQDTDQVTSAQDTPDEIKGWINRGVRAYWRKLVQANPDFGMLEAFITTTSGVFEYAPPADFLALRGADRVDGDRRYLLHGFNFRDRNRHRTAGGTGGYPRVRELRGGQGGDGVRIVFDRDPGTTTGAYLIHYVSTVPDLVNPGDKIEGVMGLEDYIIFYADACVRRKHDEDASWEMSEMARLEGEIVSLAKFRTADGNKVIGRHGGDNDYYDDDGDRAWPT